MELSNIPNTGFFNRIASLINENFDKIRQRFLEVGDASASANAAAVSAAQAAQSLATIQNEIASLDTSQSTEAAIAALDAKIAVNKAGIEELGSTVGGVTLVYGGRDLVNAGKVTWNGNIGVTDVSGHSNPIKIEKGDIVTVKGIGTYTGCISYQEEPDLEATPYSVKIYTTDTVSDKYTWTADKDGYVILSGTYENFQGTIAKPSKITPLYEDIYGINQSLTVDVRRNYKDGYVFNSSGEQVKMSGMGLTEIFIACESGDSITIHYGQTNKDDAYIIGYNNDKSQISYWSLNQSSGVRTITATEGMAYIRTSFFTANPEIVYIVINDRLAWSASDYSTKGFATMLEEKVTLMEDEVEDVDRRTDNLEEKVIGQISRYSGADFPMAKRGKRIGWNGTYINEDANSGYTDPIPIRKGDQITMSGIDRYTAYICYQQTADPTAQTFNVKRYSDESGSPSDIYTWTSDSDGYVILCGRIDVFSAQIQNENRQSNYESQKALGYTGKPKAMVGVGYSIDYVPCTPGGTVEFCFGGRNESSMYIIGYDEDKEMTHYYSCSGNPHGTRTITAPNDMYFVRMSFIIDDRSMCYIEVDGEIVWTPQTASLIGRVTALENGSGATATGIIALNPYIDKFRCAKKNRYGVKPLVFAHFSDIHGDSTNLARIIEYCSEYKDFIDDIINTGDTVYNQYSDGISWYSGTSGADKILLSIGNHEPNYWESGREVLPSDWRTHIDDCYNAFFAPFVATWLSNGIVQPSGAASNGYCYFYKDYEIQGVRLVNLNMMDYDNVQDSWFTNVLSDAKSNGRSVVVMAHFPCHEVTKFECHFSSVFSLSYPYEVEGYDLPEESVNAALRIQTFIDGGGFFWGWIVGHEHKDAIGYITAYPKQLVICTDSAKAWGEDGGISDCDGIVGEKSQDGFNIISLNPLKIYENAAVTNRITIFKVGRNRDLLQRQKDSVCISYDSNNTPTLYSETP